MTERDDPFKKDAVQETHEDAGREADPSEAISFADDEAETLSSGPAAVNNELPESADIAGQGIASGEVRAVEPPPRLGTSNLPLLVALLLVVLFGIGYSLLSGSGPSSTPEAEIAQRQPMPKRYESDKQIQEETVDQQSVAAVEPAPKADPVKQVAAVVPAIEKVEKQAALAVESTVAKPSVKPAPLYRVMVGPFLSKNALENAQAQLRELGFESQPTKGRGMVTMIRLLEGIYPVAEAREQLKKIKKSVGEAFYLPAGDKRAIYVGSFSDPERAASYAEKLAKKGVRVTQAPSDVEMTGKMLIALQADQDTARQVAALIGQAGLKTQVVRK